MSPAEALAKLHAFEQRLSSPVDFYTSHRPHWQELARESALQTCLHMQPPDADGPTWRARCAALAAQVTAALFTTEAATGVTIAIQPGHEIEFTDRETGASESTGITVEEIQEFVEAGMQGVEGGKDIRQIDAGKTPRQIAYRIYRAILNQKGSWERLLGHIREYLGPHFAQNESALAQAILANWAAVLTPAFEHDWQAYVAAEIRALG